MTVTGMNYKLFTKIIIIIILRDTNICVYNIYIVHYYNNPMKLYIPLVKVLGSLILFDRQVFKTINLRIKEKKRERN